MLAFIDAALIQIICRHVNVAGDCMGLTYQESVQQTRGELAIERHDTKDMTQKPEQNPVPPIETPTCHASQYKVQKVHHRYILSQDLSNCRWFGGSVFVVFTPQKSILNEPFLRL